MRGEVTELDAASRRHARSCILQPMAGLSQLPAHDIEKGVGAEPLYETRQPVSSSSTRTQAAPQVDDDPRVVGECPGELHQLFAPRERSANRYQ